jgi:adenylosuccinate synthase
MESFPTDQTVLARCHPIYQTLPGWQDNIAQVRAFEDLPGQARDYVLYIEELLGIPTAYISVGPGRDQTIQR